MTRTLDVWWDGRIVGQLTQDSDGALGFAYSPEWLRREGAPALSVSLPKREEPSERTSPSSTTRPVRASRRSTICCRRSPGSSFRPDWQ